MSAGINKGLSCYFWNIRSLLPKIDSVREYVYSTRPSILCLSETWLKQEIPSTLINLDDYILIREDRKTINDEGYIKRGGGLCTYVKSSIKVEQLDLDPGIPASGDIEVIVLWRFWGSYVCVHLLIIFVCTSVHTRVQTW